MTTLGRTADRSVRTGVGWAIITGLSGAVLSIASGAIVAALTMDPDEGATFVAIWFWLAGPPLSAVAIAAISRLRRWHSARPHLYANVAFAMCVVFDLVAYAILVPAPTSSPRDMDVPPTSLNQPMSSSTTTST